jgi:hypothetical protein
MAFAAQHRSCSLYSTRKLAWCRETTGGGLGLSYAAMNATDVRTELGGRFDAPTLVLGMPLIVRASVAWAHAARQNAKKKKAGAALDPTHHQRGCDPERRSNPSAPRQGIKTASASRKNRERELDIEIHPSEGRRRCRPRSTR